MRRGAQRRGAKEERRGQISLLSNLLARGPADRREGRTGAEGVAGAGGLVLLQRGGAARVAPSSSSAPGLPCPPRGSPRASRRSRRPSGASTSASSSTTPPPHGARLPPALLRRVRLPQALLRRGTLASRRRSPNAFRERGGVSLHLLSPRRQNAWRVCLPCWRGNSRSTVPNGDAKLHLHCLLDSAYKGRKPGPSLCPYQAFGSA
jgi:hypothetical protein